MKYIKTFEFKESDLEPTSSFKTHDVLNNKVWDGDVMLSDIKSDLTEIANEFWKELDIDIELKDIYLTGSLATYNYSKYSDFDLHLVVDFKESKDPDLMKRYCDQFRLNWNTKHNITIKGFEVELYVQDINEEHTANGLYSIMNEKWINIPSQKENTTDMNEVRHKAEGLMIQIDELEKDFINKENVDSLEDRIVELWKKITKGRKAGLESGGEFSLENLVFKFLRRNEYLKTLSDLKIKNYDRKYTI